MDHGAPTVVTSPLGFRALPGQPGHVVILASGVMVPLLGMAERLASSEQGEPWRPAQDGAAVPLRSDHPHRHARWGGPGSRPVPGSRSGSLWHLGSSCP